MRRSLIVIGLGACLSATPAFARDGAWYVGGDFGAIMVEDVGFDFGAGPTLPGSDSQVLVDHDYGFDGALFVGYDLGTFRLEAEVSYKRASIDELESTFLLPGSPGSSPPPPQIVSDAGGRISALSFMINGMLDFGDDDGLSGFVGAGAGMAGVDVNVRPFDNGPHFIDDSDTRFAWQIIAGVRQSVADNIDVTLRYRFFNVPDIKTVDFGGFESDTRFRSHSLLGGITFNFGGPPPP
jgi:opacity protein-like surface antigen